ncbi:MAG: hypothetical protein HY761_04755 [Candidatus Omnitrophica bacterium]|nr:hypothetical protein [Candidatus Omnitrophota bacterium]
MGLKNNKWIWDNKLPLLFIAVLLVSIPVTFAVYKFYGSQFIKTLYDLGIFQTMENQVIDYHKEAHWLLYGVIKNLFVTMFFFIFLLVSISRYKKGEYLKIHSIEWCCLVAGLFLIQWYFWVMDDAYILLRYIDNMLFLRNGLVYNKGEYVDGLSSPFMVILASFLRTTGANWANIFRLITTLSFILFWLMLVKLDRRLSPPVIGINFPLVYLTFNYAVLCHFSSWMETSIVQVLAVAYALYILNPGSRTLQVMLAMSPLVRHELIIPFVFCSVWTWLHDKKFPLKMVLLMITSLGSWVLFRIYYYADIFPNTFYYKNKINIKQGLIYVHDTFGTYHFYEVAVLFLFFIYFLKKKSIELELSKRVMMVITALPVLLYVIKIGGDWTHYRYLAFPFILITCSFSGILGNFMQQFNISKYRSAVPSITMVIILLFFSFYPVQLKRHPIFLSSTYNNSIPEEKVKRELLFDKVKITEAASLMQAGQHIHLGYITDMRDQIKKVNKKTEFKYDDIEIGIWCETDYEHFSKRIIHGWGLTDAVLARLLINSETMSGHNPVYPYAKDILNLYKSSDLIGRGMYRKAVDDGRASEWIVRNINTIEILERKIFNNHDLSENLKLAFTFPPRIKP